ncbi:MAG: winged helix DNA-binding domain-containing protein [Actinomycetota bacterium]
MRISDAERRRRLADRHHLRRGAAGGLEAVRGVAAFHSSDPVTPYLGLRARVAGFDAGHLDRLIGEDRALWRLHAMRRTLFLVPTDHAAIFLGACSLPVARKERRRLEKWLARVMDPEDVPSWMEEVSARVVEVLEDGGEWRTQELAEVIPELARRIELGAGKWATTAPVSSRLLLLLAMEGQILRTHPAGSWRSSQYRWAATSRWWDEPPRPMEDEAAARAELVRLYLSGHGPATMTDLRWWTGWTLRQVRTALAGIAAATVELDSGDQGYILADDHQVGAGTDGPVVAFLPGLDPTPMGWKERSWYIATGTDQLFDSSGNVGPTVWADGRVVGGWGQLPDGKVVYELVETVATDTRLRIADEAEELGRWLDGEVVSVRFRTPLERKLARQGT